MRPMNTVDDADIAPGIARQTGVAGRIDLLGAHLLANRKARWRVDRPLEPPTLSGGCRDPPSGERRRRFCGSGGGSAALEFGGSNEAALFKPRDQPGQPFLVIGHPQIIGRPDTLDRMPARINVPFPESGCCAVERQNAALPRLVKDRLVGLRRDRPHLMHAAHIVDAVHREAPASVTLAVPIIASRVTRAASSSSLICSEPAGRSGNTR